jgi:hypothetical protein
MKNVMLFLSLSFLTQIFAITVDGYAYLEGETDHSGIEVFFQRVVPDTLVRYTVYTDSIGYYSSAVEGGWYDIFYSKSGFISKDTADFSLYSNTTLADISLSKINMIFEAGVHVITENIEVLEGDTLIIKPGARLELDTGIGIDVYGMIMAEGTENDSIIFTGYNGRNWGTVTLYNSCSDDSKINHCYFEKSGSCALYIGSCALTVENSTFYNNSWGGTSISAGGITVGGNEYPVIRNCRFYNNTGGGIMISSSFYGHIIVENCVFRGNTNDQGGAICVWNAGPLISQCIIEQNFAEEGGGIYISSYKSDSGFDFVQPMIRDCIIKNNSADQDGAGLFVGDMDVTVANSLIYNNTGHGIYAQSDMKIYNSIVAGNDNYGIYNSSYKTHNIKNSNIFGNTNGEVYNKQDYLLVNVTTNANGDPCDSYYNISMDPLFLDEWNGDFMLTENSPCIDAGTNNITDYEFPMADLDGNYRIWDGNSDSNAIVDMGAYEYGAISVGIEDNPTEISDHALSQNYPNPFNPVTTISYSLPKAAQVELNVYNLQGQLVQSLFDGKQVKGIHKAEFSAQDLTSGIYIYNLKVDNKVVSSKKMMLLK